MRRILSLTLALVMVLGTFAGVFAAEAEITPAEFLKEVGVLEGDDGDLMLDKTLLRRDSVILLSRLMGAEDVAEDFPGAEDILTFEDITDAYYNGYLAWAVSNKLFEGHDEATFGFNENVTAQDYATVLLRALGYEMDDAAWAKALETAKELEILADVEVENKTEITRDQMAVMTYNALKAEMKDSSQTLAEKLGIEMPEAPKAKELTAEVNDTKNLKEVVVELSNADLADEDKLENVNNYVVVDGSDRVVVEKAEIVGDDVVLLLEGTLKKDKEYKLRIRSINRAINNEYKFIARDNTLPTVEEVVVLGEYGIKVVTSEPVRAYSYDRDRGRNFVIDGKNIAMNVETYGRNLILTPYYNESFSSNAKTLTISGLEDYAGFRSAREEFDIEIVEDLVAPEVVDVILRSDKEIEVVFDKDVYIDSISGYKSRSNTGNVSYLAGRHTEYAMNDKDLDTPDKIDTNKVKYRFKDDFLRKRTDFTIEGVQNHSKVKMDKTTWEAREILDNVEPEIIDRKLKDKNIDAGTATVELYFDKNVKGHFIDENSFEVGKHFELYERDVHFRNIAKDAKVIKAYYGDRNDIVKVELKGLEKWTKNNELDYILEIRDFTNESSTRDKMYRDYFDFKFEPSTVFQVVEIEAFQSRSDSRDAEVKIVFSEPVDRFIAEDPTNYILVKPNGTRKDVKELDGRIVTEKAGEEVTLILPDVNLGDYKNIRILDILRDKDDNRLEFPYEYDISSRTFTWTDKGVKKGIMRTSVSGSIIAPEVDRLVIDAPYAHVIISGGATYDIVQVDSIAATSLEIKAGAKVEKLVVNTKKGFNVTGDVKTLEATVEGAKITLNGSNISLEKGKVIDSNKDPIVIETKINVTTAGAIQIGEVELEVELEDEKATHDIVIVIDYKEVKVGLKDEKVEDFAKLIKEALVEEYELSAELEGAYNIEIKSNKPLNIKITK